ncbi:MAG: DUF6531 domain-containing protein [Microthrixaceae bacterium]|nr:DUF6531 domain-containing protein [Microthrixaceae bacterium]
MRSTTSRCRVRNGWSTTTSAKERLHPQWIHVRRRDLACCPVGYADDPVNTFTGSFTDTAVDLEFPANLAGLEWSRFYDSGGVAGAAQWRFSYSDHLEVAGDDMELWIPEGRIVVFEGDGSGGFERAKEFDGQLTTAGSGWELTLPAAALTISTPTESSSRERFGMASRSLSATTPMTGS